jgi:hypothetical protein
MQRLRFLKRKDFLIAIAHLLQGFSKLWKQTNKSCAQAITNSALDWQQQALISAPMQASSAIKFVALSL